MSFAVFKSKPLALSTEVYRIAALLEGGMPVDAVLADYPSLTFDQVVAAKAYADAHPKPGRPYPPITAKQALRGAGLDAVDEVLGREGGMFDTPYSRFLLPALSYVGIEISIGINTMPKSGAV